MGKGRVVISSNYLDILERKSFLLDEVFFGGDEARINAGSFKQYMKLAKRDGNADTSRETYVAPKEKKPKADGKK